MSRTRSINRYAVGKMEDQYNSSTPTSVGYQSGSPIVPNYDWLSQITDELTPVGWDRAVNPCSHFKCKGGTGSFQTYIQYAGNPSICNLKFKIVARPGSSLSYQLPAGDWAGLAGKLADRLNGRIDEGSLIGVSAIELAKTVAMIRNPFSLMKPNWRNFTYITSKKGHKIRLAARDLQKKEGSVKRLSNIWLEHRYGWNALWQDIKAVSKTTAKMLADSDPTDDGGGYDAITEQEQFSGVNQGYYYLPGDNSSYWSDWYINNWPSVGASGNYRIRFRTMDSKGVYRVGCKQAIESAQRWSRTKRLINAYGLDASSIASVLWEIVPFSFVVDWFIDPLGIWQTPSNRLRLHASDVKNLCASLTVVSSLATDVLLCGNPFGATTNWAYRQPQVWGVGYFPGIFNATFKSYQRWNDIPGGSMSSVFTDKDLSLIQKVSGIALLAQKFT